jgi:hypothetical protein
MLSTIKLEKIIGDCTQDVNAWLVIFFQWTNLYDLPDHKVINVFPFQLEENAKIWYDALPYKDKTNSNPSKILFQERFKEPDNFFFRSFCITNETKCQRVGFELFISNYKN